MKYFVFNQRDYLFIFILLNASTEMEIKNNARFIYCVFDLKENKIVRAGCGDYFLD